MNTITKYFVVPDVDANHAIAGEVKKGHRYEVVRMNADKILVTVDFNGVECVVCLHPQKSLILAHEGCFHLQEVEVQVIEELHKLRKSIRNEVDGAFKDEVRAQIDSLSQRLGGIEDKIGDLDNVSAFEPGGYAKEYPNLSLGYSVASKGAIYLTPYPESRFLLVKSGIIHKPEKDAEHKEINRLRDELDSLKKENSVLDRELDNAKSAIAERDKNLQIAFDKKDALAKLVAEIYALLGAECPFDAMAAIGLLKQRAIELDEMKKASQSDAKKARYLESVAELLGHDTRSLNNIMPIISGVLEKAGQMDELLALTGSKSYAEMADKWEGLSTLNDRIEEHIEYRMKYRTNR